MQKMLKREGKVTTIWLCDTCKKEVNFGEIDRKKDNFIKTDKKIYCLKCGKNAN